MTEKTLRPTRSRLRYIDVFDSKYQLGEYSVFVENQLGIAAPIRAEVLEALGAEPKGLAYSIDGRFSVEQPPRSTMRLTVSPGRSEEGNAVVMELHCDGDISGAHLPEGSLLTWYDQAHENLRKLFQEIISPDLEAKFGKKLDITQ